MCYLMAVIFTYSCVPNNHGPLLLDFLFLVGAHVYKIVGSYLLALNTRLLGANTISVNCPLLLGFQRWVTAHYY